MFSLNVGMVLHVLKGDPSLRDPEHVQVDSPGTAYLFFYDKQGCRGLKQDATETLQTHVAEAFSEWISCPAHFVIILGIEEDPAGNRHGHLWPCKMLILRIEVSGRVVVRVKFYRICVITLELIFVPICKIWV